MAVDGAVTWQRALRPRPSSTSSGVTCEQTGIASGQRSTNLQPAVGSMAAASAPVGRMTTRWPPVAGFGTADRSRRVYGMERVLQHVLDGAALDDLAGVHDQHLVCDVPGAREVVGHVEEREPVPFLELEDQVEDPDPDRDVEHRGRLVGDDHRRLDRQRACDRDALPLAAGQLVRVLRGDPLGRHQADRLEQLVHPLFQLSVRHQAVDLQGPRDVVADRLDRVQRPERILEDHLHLRAVAQDVGARALARDVAAVEHDAAGRRASRGAGAGARRCSCRCRSRRRAR